MLKTREGKWEGASVESSRREAVLRVCVCVCVVGKEDIRLMRDGCTDCACGKECCG